MKKSLFYIAILFPVLIPVLGAQRAPAATAISMPASETELSPEASRKLLAVISPSVVSVRTITKTTMAMDGRESSKDDTETESTGVVVNATGLTAVSLTGIDPSNLYGDLMAQRSGDSTFSVQSEISEIKIHYSNGTEVLGEVAIRDRDLDLAFIAPKTKLNKPVPFIDLSDATDADILDPVLTVSRFGKQNRWELVASIEYVQAVLTKPRRMYLVESLTGQLGSALGSLAFSPKGKLLGVELLRKVPSTGKDRPQLLLVVLPAKELLAVAKQVETDGKSASVTPKKNVATPDKSRLVGKATKPRP